MTEIPGDLVRCAEQPDKVEIHIAGGLFVKQMRFPAVGVYIPQHSHASDHLSMLAHGAVRVWKDGVLLGDRHAPTGILIEAGSMHTFQSLLPDTVIYCIHNIGERDYPELLAENHLVA